MVEEESVPQWKVLNAAKSTSLPDPNAAENPVDGTLCGSANREITTDPTISKRETKRKHSTQVMVITMMLLTCRLQNMYGTAKKFSKECERSVSYTTIQSICNEYLKELKSGGDTMDALPAAKHGRLLLIGDELVRCILEHVKAIRRERGCMPLKIIALALAS